MKFDLMHAKGGFITWGMFIESVYWTVRIEVVAQGPMSRKALQPVVRASVWHETLKIHLHDSRIVPSRIYNATYECSRLGNVESEQQ